MNNHKEIFTNFNPFRFNSPSNLSHRLYAILLAIVFCFQSAVTSLHLNSESSFHGGMGNVDLPQELYIL